MLLNLSDKSIFVSKSLFCIESLLFYVYLVNIYDINSIAISYLTLWRKEDSLSVVSPLVLMSQFPPYIHGIIKKYFPSSIKKYYKLIIDGILFNSYFIFCCIFMFYSADLVFSLLLTLSCVYSNIVISLDQIKEFISNYDLDSHFYDIVKRRHDIRVVKDINKTSFSSKLPDKMMLIEEFKLFCFSDSTYIKNILHIKYVIMNNIYSTTHFERIVKRVIYYYENPSLACNRNPFQELIRERCSTSSSDTSTNTSIQVNSSDRTVQNYKESCSSRFYRTFINYSLPPLYFDYGNNNPSKKDFDEVILMVKRLFGYPIRFNRSFNNIRIENKDTFDTFQIDG